MPRRTILMFAGACIAVAAALAVTTMVVVNGRPDPSSSVVTSTGQPDVGGPFRLVSQNGQAVDQTLLDGKWSLVFFGFTYCPDYCPTTLGVLEATRQALGARADNLQIVFITVDPARDTPQALKDYLSSDGFPEGVIGLTGTPEQVRAAADAYRAVYQKVGEGEAYTMNHSLTVYLMGPDGKFRSALAHDLGPERSARLIAQAMDRG
ncbi:MAG: SCO family protein [Brevundimonas sp.]|uniref:SCO family protein n=1 Tax=Brevundimonas sp. TaxID=1871086 RepID=UPI002726F101|nr:SCO family protein [Brevundimonas sp.]MDO9587997.1 SCO family protein [Brevundimonas sp.]MDP3368267.1 SCO family protein [Brevundimonas sp.]MDP3656705.1 SCO family protein [Brevundimonas sp.]MDZ4109267.1 SCO family protein [Brevundimonas sp.]